MASSALAESSLQQVIPLDLLNTGESGTIVDVVGPSSWKHRLEELGLCEGTQIRMVKSGEPCILAIADQRLSFRLDAGTMVLVETHLKDDRPSH